MLIRKYKEAGKSGFTLAELLVVVAIIAILVAVSIPIFTGKLEETRESTDVANMRAAKAVAVENMLNGDYENSIWRNEKYEDGEKQHLTYYDADKGSFVKEFSSITPYGKGTEKEGNLRYADYKNGENYKDHLIVIEIDEHTEADSEVIIYWADKNNHTIPDMG